MKYISTLILIASVIFVTWCSCQHQASADDCEGKAAKDVPCYSETTTNCGDLATSALCLGDPKAVPPIPTPTHKEIYVNKFECTTSANNTCYARKYCSGVAIDDICYKTYYCDWNSTEQKCVRSSHPHVTQRKALWGTRACEPVEDPCEEP